MQGEGRLREFSSRLSLIRWIGKRNTIQIAWIEPPADSLWAARRSLLKSDERVVGGFEAICRNGQNGGDQLALIFVENLHGMAIRLWQMESLTGWSTTRTA